MAGFAGLTSALSGLNAALSGLSTTGHNLANANIKGYTRQQSMQQDFRSQTISYTRLGAMQVGLGTDISGIRQIRDVYLDIPYRQDMGKFGFHDVLLNAGIEVQQVFSEMEGAYKMQSVLTDLWSAMHELDMNPTTIETRANFIESCKVFINKFDQAYKDMYEYQLNLNDQVKSQVQRINQLVGRVQQLNMKIAGEELTGARANDYRDERNNCLDELSKMVNITYKERPNHMVDIMVEGKDLLSNGNINTLGLRYTSPDWPFVEPVFTTSTTILQYDPRPGSMSDCLYDFSRYPVNANYDNDRGSLKGLLVARGNQPATFMSSLGQTKARNADGTYNTTWEYTYGNPPKTLTGTYGYDSNGITTNPQYYRDKFDMESAFIPRVQMELDTMFNTIVTMINDRISPKEIEQATFTGADLENYDPADPTTLLWKGLPVYGVSTTEAWVSPVYAYDEKGNILENPPGSGNKVIDHYEAAPYDLSKEQPLLEVFSRNAPAFSGRYDYTTTPPTYKEERYDTYYSQYTIGNVKLNDAFASTAGYTKVAVSATRELHGKTALESIVNMWGKPMIGVDTQDKLSVDEYYRWLTTVDVALRISESDQFVQAQTVLIEQDDFRRQAIMGASMDEEMRNMMVYQHAYNAAARIATVIDGMLDRVINHTGRVGL